MNFVYNMFMNVCFGERLRQLRTEQGLKQAELATALETTQRRISYLELGKIEPDLRLLRKICDFFDVSADFLLGRKEY